jgi:hemerythrin superfamily protein
MAQHDHVNETMTEPDDAMAMLKADHRQVRILLQQYEATPDPYLKQIIAEHVFAGLALHALLEETIFYPALAELADAAGKQLVDDALQDHQRLRDLITDLREIDDDAAFEARFHALRDHVDQHIEEEESAMFPQAAQALREHLEEITALMQARKAEILASQRKGVPSEAPWHTHERRKHAMADWREALQHAMYPVLTRLLQEGFVLPLYVTCIGRNGSMMCGRY